MIKVGLEKNLLYERPKIFRQSFSLKNNLIVFSTEPTQSPSKNILLSQSFISKRLDSPTKKTSERLKKQRQRQRYVQQFQQINENNSAFISKQLIKNPESLMKRSNSHKISTSQTFRSSKISPDENIRSSKITKSSRTQEAQLPVSSPQKQSYSKIIELNEDKNKAIQLKTTNFDFKRVSNVVQKNEGPLTCRSLRKCTQIQFYNQQISTLLSKKGNIEQRFKDQDSNDETSFNVILKKIRQKNKSQTTQAQKRKSKYMDKIKSYQIQTKPTNLQIQKNINEIVNGKIPNSAADMRKYFFKSALQWSNQQVEMMKKTPTKRKQFAKNISKTIQVKKQDDRIEGWGK